MGYNDTHPSIFERSTTMARIDKLAVDAHDLIEELFGSALADSFIDENFNIDR